ncbi:hypothetical protein B0H10DRAFT_2435433 [Mycena sp. CBHHK59/15]|nr:hypothetical protein B0H10DRAFT_2435433 [Mycena sp. CBHHK59/15]
MTTFPADDNIRWLFNFCPPKLTSHADDGILPDQCLTFYDRHLDEKLILRRVVPHSTLVSSLAGIADTEYKLVTDLGLTLPNDAYQKGHDLEQVRYWDLELSNPVGGSKGVAIYYAQTIAAVCHPIASLLLIRPLSWYSVLMWNDRGSGKHPNEFDNPYMQNGFSLSIRHSRRELRIKPQILSRFDDETKEHLLGLAKHCPVLASWQIYTPAWQTDDLLCEMDRIVSFGPCVSGTGGSLHVPSRCVRTPDASISASLLKGSPEITENSHSVSFVRVPNLPRRSSRLKDMSRTSNPKTPSSKPKDPPPNRTRFPRIHLPSVADRSTRPRNDRLAEEFLQHGWNQAVHEDSSFIIYTNGNTERIGIRHRETQTLFLSDIIYAPKCNPAYVRVHVGLYISAFRDNVDRYTQMMANGTLPTTSVAEDTLPATERDKKRRNVDVDVPAGLPKKKKRANADTDLPSSIERVFTEASSRNLMLVRLSYGNYNSVNPSSFIRRGPTLFPTILPPPPGKPQNSYTANQYFTVTVGPEISTGATGAVHDALLEVKTKTGDVLTQSVVIKLAFYPEQRQRMQNEFVAYERLAASNVTGVPAILGIFDDVDGTANTLIMNHCGESLQHTRLLGDQRNVRVSVAEKAAFLAIIDDVHRAGVRHRDMRPANLLLNNAGQATIIDFDRAELDPPQAGRKREYSSLKRLLEGDFTDDDAVRTE